MTTPCPLAVLLLTACLVDQHPIRPSVIRSRLFPFKAIVDIISLSTSKKVWRIAPERPSFATSGWIML